LNIIKPRPAAFLWASYQLIAHILFGADYLMLTWMPADELTQCLTLVSVSFFS